MGLGTLIELKELNTPANLQYLAVLLDVVLKDDAVGKLVWDAFGRRFTNAEVVEKARTRLYRIKRLLDEHRRKA